PAVQAATPAPAIHPRSKDGGEEANPFSLDSGIARLNAPANQGKISLDFNPPPRIQAPNLAPRRFDDGARAATVEGPSATLVVAAPRTLDTPKAESQTLWRRLKSLFATAFSGSAPLALVGFWLALCTLMSWRVARSY